ncbi:MAG: mitochondrial fission ELM1 family protein [Alphaproteobacteria bacterium]|nr:mitochondrial fission ELM1 family protein [Alphaproteobacteria bacterium]MBU0858814.1 mitochondrial fission ELM1 family protein [Alphaproteobacteria bacterium]
MTSCWIVTEHGLTGTENQCRGVAAAMGLDPVIKRIGLRQPWKTLSPFLGFECACTFTGDPLTAPWPDLVIASGRKSIAAARYIKKRSPHTKLVQIQDPRAAHKIFDLIAVPHHDPARGDNILVTDAAPNMITPEKLKAARTQFAPLLENIAQPRVAVLIGGDSKAHKLTTARMITLCAHLKNLMDHGYGLMITASRRTGAAQKKILTESLPGALIWDGTGDNPYHGFLAWADYIMVTADSVSMIAEAATTGKPVYLIPLDGGSRRFDRFYHHLQKHGAVRPFEGTLSPYDYVPLHDAGLVAESIHKLMQTAK